MVEEGDGAAKGLPLVLKVGRAIHSEVDRDRLLNESLSAIVAALGASGGSVMLIDDDSQELIIAAATALDPEVLRESRPEIGEGIAGWVARTGEPLLLKGSVQSPDFQGVNPSITSALSVPIRLQAHIMGVLNVRNVGGASKGAFSESDLETLKSIAGELAVALSRASLFKQTEEQARQALGLYELARASCTVFQPENTSRIILDMIGGQMEAPFLLMVELDAKTHALRYRDSRGVSPPAIPGQPVASAELDFLMGAIEKDGPQILPASEISERLGGRWAAANLEQFLVNRLQAEGRVIGALVVARPPGRPFSKTDVDYFSALCDQAALAVRNSGIASRLEEAAITRERNRISQEIHDGLTQSLAGLVLQLERIKRLCHTSPERVADALDAAINRARSSLAETRDYMRALRDSASSGANPAPAIMATLDEFGATSGTHAELVVLGAERSVPAGVARALLRITQESLANIRKHAQASEVKVTLTFEDKWVELKVADNGIGFETASVLDKAYAEGRFGVVGMRERCDALDGTLKLESAPGRGTTVSVRLPTNGTYPPPQS